MLRPLSRVSDTDIATYRARFVNRDDVYARQWSDGRGWSRVSAHLTDQVLRAHLAGALTVGFYTPGLEGTTRWVCIDFDTADGTEKGRALQRWLAERGVSCAIERSAGGRCHAWVFFDAPVDAGVVRAAAASILTELGWQAEPGAIEVFPKHERVQPDGYGALMRGPLGRHRRAGGEIFPVIRLDVGTGRYYSGGLATLLATPVVTASTLVSAAPAQGANVMTIAPTTPPRPYEAGSASPVTQAIYARLSVREVLAERGVSVNGAGKALCPFHDDHHPSLQDYGTRFYCFGCGARGDVIGLYQRLHHLPDRWRARDALADRLGIDPDERRGAGRAMSVVRRHPRVIQLSFWKELSTSSAPVGHDFEANERAG
jgi:hypothetical protein